MVKVKSGLILITDNSCNGLHASDSAAEPAIVLIYFVLEPPYNGYFLLKIVTLDLLKI